MIGRGDIEPRHANRAAAHLPVRREQRRCGLGGAGGEHDMLGLCVDQLGDRSPCLLDQAACGTPFAMDRRRIGVDLERGKHRGPRRGQERCARIVIEIGACCGHSSPNRLSLRRYGPGSFISLNFQGQPSYLPALPTGRYRRPVLNNSKLASMETLVPRQGRSVGVPDWERMVAGPRSEPVCGRSWSNKKKKPPRSDRDGSGSGQCGVPNA